MKIKDILNYLCKLFPLDTAMDFDNVGLLVGNSENEVTSAVVSLDCTSLTVSKAKEVGANLIITHHPVIFNPVKKVLKGDIVYTLIKNDISVISMHTNLDIAKDGVNDCLAKILKLENIIPIKAEDGFSFRMGELSEALSADSFADSLKKVLNTPVKFCGDNIIRKVAVCSGSGAEFLNCAKQNNADAFVTSECKHHLFNEAYEKGIALFDAGHFSTEDIIVSPLAEMLKAKFPDIKFTENHETYIKFSI